MRGTLLSLLLETAVLSTTVATKCYFSDGSETNGEMEPCFPSKSASSCCSINKKGNLANDVCLHNGLCIAQVAQYSGMIFQNACTDQSWESPDCPNVCGSCTFTTDRFLFSGKCFCFSFLRTNNIQLSPKIQEHTSFPVRNEESDIGAAAQTEQNAATTHFE